MLIHKSFSKQDLIEIMNDFNIHIDNYTSHNKLNLVNLFLSYIEGEHDIDFKNTKLYKSIINKQQLLDYLQNQNPNKLLSVKEKNKVMQFCKEVIHYCNHGFVIENTIFSSFEEIVIQLNDVKQYGHIPSVRRACRLMNGHIDVKEKFVPIIPPRIQEELELKKKRKMRKVKTLIYKRGKFFVDFK
tara:strand:- start:477 stop:1034 length:558 start_codon:yes stop_codon:yes gene_type:complete